MAVRAMSFHTRCEIQGYSHRKRPASERSLAMHEAALNQTPPTPILVPVRHAAVMLGRGVQAIYDLIGGGKIRAVKSDGRTLIVVESLHEYAASLPPAKIAPPRNRSPQRMR